MKATTILTSENLRANVTRRDLLIRVLLEDVAVVHPSGRAAAAAAHGHGAHVHAAVAAAAARRQRAVVVLVAVPVSERQRRRKEGSDSLSRNFFATFSLFLLCKVRGRKRKEVGEREARLPVWINLGAK